MPVVSILLETTNYNFELFVTNFKKKWRLRFEPYREGDSLGMIIDGMVIGCVFFPVPLVEIALIQSARDNTLWPEAETCALKHRAHLKVTMAQEKNPVVAYSLFSKVIYSLLQQPNVSGVYLKPNFLEPVYYFNRTDSPGDQHDAAGLFRKND